MSFTPDNLEFVFLSFEGPDQPYAQAGGLGVRVTQLTRALARHGFQTHLVFVGDPALPGGETREDGRLHLHRWCQWISASHPEGAYADEIAKVHDYQDSVPAFVTQAIVEPAVAAGRRVAVIAEEWHTADALSRLSDSMHFLGIRDSRLCCSGTPITTCRSTASTGIAWDTWRNSRQYLASSRPRCGPTASTRW